MKIRRIPLFISIALIGGLAYVLGWSNLFPVKEVRVASNEKKIDKEILTKINANPAVISIGQPLARLDKREIATRLRELLWVDNVKVSRSLLSGRVTIEVSPRRPLARLDQSNSSSMGQVGYLGENLKLFYLPTSAVEKASAAGDINWSKLPILKTNSTDEQFFADIKELITNLRQAGFLVQEVGGRSAETLDSRVAVNKRNLQITWGNINDLALKLQVAGKLLELKENKRITYMDLTNPLTPSVR